MSKAVGSASLSDPDVERPAAGTVLSKDTFSFKSMVKTGVVDTLGIFLTIELTLPIRLTLN